MNYDLQYSQNLYIFEALLLQVIFVHAMFVTKIILKIMLCFELCTLGYFTTVQK